MKRHLIYLLLSASPFFTVDAFCADNANFTEEFVLSKNRAETLKKLVPGTEKYYYFYCLHFQNQKQYGKVEVMLKSWMANHATSSKITEIRNRQALLTYQSNPEASLEYLKKNLNPILNHQQIRPDRKSSLPISLDQNLINFETLKARALRDSSTTTVGGFTRKGLNYLTTKDVTPARRRYYLQQLITPDHPELVEMVVADLGYKYSRGFGSLSIHRLLTLKQMEQCLEKKGSLLNDRKFVMQYLGKLAPVDGTDLSNPVEQRKYLGRLKVFSDRLSPSFNSLKACVIYNLLQLDRREGRYDAKLFDTYLKLPRTSNVTPSSYLKQSSSKYHVYLNRRFPETNLKAIDNDYELIRSYLLHFFVDAKDWSTYNRYLTDQMLKQTFAESKLTNGIGKPEKWVSLLTPSTYKALQARVDLDLSVTNKSAFSPNDKVELKVDVKNVKTLFVKIYEINLMNYYRQFGKEPSLELDLEGLVPNEEQVHKYNEDSLRRVTRTFTFPSMKKRGAYILDFIGNGKTSRALIQKGKIRFIEKETEAGHAFRLLADDGKVIKTGKLWLGGKVYNATQDGYIFVPYSTAPSTQKIILTDGDFCALASFKHRAESYTLAGRFYVDREALLKNRRAKVIVRPDFRINQMSAKLNLLKDVRLTIKATDSHGVDSNQVVANPKLSTNGEFVHSFKVPANLHIISFSLTAKVQNMSTNKMQNLTSSDSYSVNGIDRTNKIMQAFFTTDDKGCLVEIVGKNGEPKVNSQVNFRLRHRLFRSQVNVSLQSDNNGQIRLGKLTDITSVHATLSNQINITWTPPENKSATNPVYYAAAGEDIRIPYSGTLTKLDYKNVMLMEYRSRTPVTDRLSNLSVKNGYLAISGLPVGTYSLVNKDENETIRIKILDGEVVAGHVISKTAITAQSHPQMQITETKISGDKLIVQTAHGARNLRLHVIATRYLPEFSLFERLHAYASQPVESYSSVPGSYYASGQNLSDEYNYILKRNYAPKFPGNMLARPGLLLNPFELNETRTQSTEFSGLKSPIFKGGGRSISGRKQVQGRSGGKIAGRTNDSVLMDFLGHGSTHILNIRPDQNGRIEIPLNKLGDKQHIHLLAVDKSNTVYRQIALPLKKMETYETRLVNNLNPKNHYIEAWQQDVVNTGDTFTINDITTTKFQIYDSLQSVYDVLATLGNNETFKTFSFIPKWAKMSEKEKLNKFNKYTCHELNYFIFRKDKGFFQKHVVSYLRNKRDKTFMDNWLLKNSLQPYVAMTYYRNRLNTVEKILFGGRVTDTHTARFIREQFELIPPNPTLQTYLYNTAVAGNLLAGKGIAARAARRSERKLAQKGKKMRESEVLNVENGNSPLRFSKNKSNKSERPRPVKKPSLGVVGETSCLEDECVEEECVEDWGDDDCDEGLPETAAEIDLYSEISKARKRSLQLYRQLPPTKELAENNYFKLPIGRQNKDLVRVNAFWNDFAHKSGKPVRSANFLTSSNSFTEMMLTLGSLDLPFKGKAHKTVFNRDKLTITAASPMVIFHKQIVPTKADAVKNRILVTQQYFDSQNRYEQKHNRRVERYLQPTGEGIEMLAGHVYGCRVVFTNPTAQSMDVNVLLQIPKGAIPVNNGFFTKSMSRSLGAYTTQTVDYQFYFPKIGSYPHFPAHVSADKKLAAFCTAQPLKVVNKLSTIDKTSWFWVSQYGSDQQVWDYLATHNLNRIDLQKIAFRMKNRTFYAQTLKLLRQFHIYSPALWAYSMVHQDTENLRRWLESNHSFRSHCGMAIDAPLLRNVPVMDRFYQHLDYSPLINARAHSLTGQTNILNNNLSRQYKKLMEVLKYYPELDDEQELAVCYYLLLQDRIPEAIETFAKIDGDKVREKIQYDYMKVYVSFFQEELVSARAVAMKYADYPVDHWRNLFNIALTHLDEAAGKAVAVVDRESRESQTSKAAQEPVLDFKIEGSEVTIFSEHLKTCRINYYKMDIELLFSKQPFLKSYGNRSVFIEPNKSQEIVLNKKGETKFSIPKEFQSGNVQLELSGAGLTSSDVYFANSLNVRLEQNYGQVKVMNRAGKGLVKSYVKVYAKMKNGSTHFIKDGYTDIRGRFDYASVSTMPAGYTFKQIARFAILIMSDKNGAVIKEARPPKR